MNQLALQWYMLLSALNASVAYPIRAASDAIGIPALSALLFGLIGATAPCQLTTGAGAVAYLARSGRGDATVLVRNTASFVLGKALIYTLLGLAIIVAGRQVLPVTAIVVVRRLLGPMMLLMGVQLLNLLPRQLRVTLDLGGWLRTHAGDGVTGAFLLGGAFGLAFCPTLFLLYFGLTIPLALASPFGVAYPALFAVGTTLPLIALLAVFRAGAPKPSLRNAQRAGRWLQQAAGLVLLVVGIGDTLTYWLL